jgi:glycosyltransferase involved in cell wall biosynthesis
MKTKILYTIPNFDTAGSGRVVYDLVKGIDKKKFVPEILVKHTKGDFFKEVEKLGVPIHVFPYETNYYPLWSFPFRLIKVIHFFKKLKVDIIHSWHYSSDFSEVLAARFAGIKFVYTKKNMGWGNKAWVWKSKLSNQVIAINKDMMKDFFNPIPNIKAIYLPLGIDTDYYMPREFDSDLAKEYEIEEHDFIVISVANLVPLKGIETLIEAFKQLEIPNSKLLIVGNHQNEYAQQLMQEHQDKQIIFTGKQMDVRPFLSLANVFCIPTLSVGEGMPMAPLEAMSMGVPVIGSNVSGISDILEGFEEWIFEADNKLDLKTRFLKFHSQLLEEKSEIGKQMRNKVMLRYTLVEFIQRKETFYEKLYTPI